MCVVQVRHRWLGQNMSQYDHAPSDACWRLYGNGTRFSHFIFPSHASVTVGGIKWRSMDGRDGWVNVGGQHKQGGHLCMPGLHNMWIAIYHSDQQTYRKHNWKACLCGYANYAPARNNIIMACSLDKLLVVWIVSYVTNSTPWPGVCWD